MLGIPLALVVLGGTLVCTAVATPDSGWVRRTISYLGFVLWARYAVWRVTSTLPEFDGSFISIAAYVLCALEMTTTVIYSTSPGRKLIHRVRRRHDEVDAHADTFATTPPRVSVLIPTYNEDASILRRTITGAKCLRYPNFDIWVLDDGSRDWLRQLCDDLHVNYLRRATNAGFKSGNLNNGLRHINELGLRPDYVAVFDADFVPHQEFVNRTLPLMHDDAVGIVQTPQFYFNPDPFHYAFGSQSLWPDDTRLYMLAQEPCMDALGGARCVGTSFLARVSALEKIGGFATEAVADDTLTSVKLFQQKIRTVYLTEALSTGLAVDSVAEMWGQRGRWTLGNLQIALSPWGPIARRGKLRGLRAVLPDYAWGFLGVLTNWLWLFFPPLFFFTGEAIFMANTQETISYVLPMFLMRFGRVWIDRGVGMPIIFDSQYLALSPALMKATIQATLRPTAHAFRVTGKGELRNKDRVYWPIVLPSGAMIVVYLAAILYSVTPGSPTMSFDLQGWIYMFAFLRLMSLYICCCVGIEKARYRAAERFPANLAAQLHVGGDSIAVQVLDLSEGGCRIYSTSDVAVGATGTIAFERVGSISSQLVRQAGEHEYGVKFRLGVAEYTALIRELYTTGRYTNPRFEWSLRRAYLAILRSLAGFRYSSTEPTLVPRANGLTVGETVIYREEEWHKRSSPGVAA